MSKSSEFLNQVYDDLKGGKNRSCTVRTLLGEFGFQRRGATKASIVKKALRKHKLATEPDLLVPYIDERIQFKLVDLATKDKPDADTKPEPKEETAGAESVPAANDPTYRINKLEAANLEAAGRSLVTVSPNATIEEAVTEMLAGDYSQLPVMNGRSVRGMISWRSLGKRLALGQPCGLVQDSMDDAVVVSSEMSIFQAINEIVDHGYVLVQREDKSISGIVTTSDLSTQFRILSEPFLVLAEIENHLRDLIDAKFTKDDLQMAKDPSDEDRRISSASDMSFGEYLRLLENEERWKKVELKLDRKSFVKKLDAVRIIRNDVMHFDPEGIGDQDLEALRSFVKFLRGLREVGAY